MFHAIKLLYCIVLYCIVLYSCVSHSVNYSQLLILTLKAPNKKIAADDILISSNRPVSQNDTEEFSCKH